MGGEVRPFEQQFARIQAFDGYQKLTFQGDNLSRSV